MAALEVIVEQHISPTYRSLGNYQVALTHAEHQYPSNQREHRGPLGVPGWPRLPESA
jgi:hypothetical protein